MLLQTAHICMVVAIIIQLMFPVSELAHSHARGGHCSTYNAFRRQVSVDRVLALPHANNAMARLDSAVRTASAARSMTNVQARGDAAQMPSENGTSVFSSFYSHLGGSARCFDIFDANDTALWAQALPFAHIFVFPTAALARRALDAYLAHLSPIAPLLLQVASAQVGLQAVDTGNVVFRVWYVTQCRVYHFKDRTDMNSTARSSSFVCHVLIAFDRCAYVCAFVQLAMHCLPGAMSRNPRFGGT